MAGQCLGFRPSVASPSAIRVYGYGAAIASRPGCPSSQGHPQRRLAVLVCGACTGLLSGPRTQFRRVVEGCHASANDGGPHARTMAAFSRSRQGRLLRLGAAGQGGPCCRPSRVPVFELARKRVTWELAVRAMPSKTVKLTPLSPGTRSMVAAMEREQARLNLKSTGLTQNLGQL